MTHDRHAERWLRTLGSVDAPASLICVPHAGAGASCYASWRKQLPAFVALHGVQLPGREDRWGESLLTDIETAAGMLAPYVMRHAAAPTTVLFGHSMGGLLAHALARRLEALARPVAHVIVSGCQPVGDETGRRIADLDDDEFIAEVSRRGGLPEELIASRRHLAVFLPTLRADIRMAEAYSPAPEAPLTSPLTAFAGVDDVHAPWEAVGRWRDYTAAAFDTIRFPGSHFFVNTAREEVLAAVRVVVTKAMP